MSDQGQIFRSSEGDAWFRRNQAKLQPDGLKDPGMRLLKLIDVDMLQKVSSVCDVGCSNGYRLLAARSLLRHVSRFCGFDASQEAIAAGVERGGLDLKVGLIEQPPFEECFDLVMVSFVLHWVDRSKLSSTLAAVDRLVAPGGLLLIQDFLPDRPTKRPYHHLPDANVFTFKQDYGRAFEAMGLYAELARLTFGHDRSDKGVAPAAPQERAMCALLYKTPDAFAVS